MRLGKSATRTIRQSVTIAAAPAAVYQMLVRAKQHAAFTQAAATGTARVGACFTAWDGYISGRHLELEPGRRIVQEWVTTEWPKGASPSRVEIVLEPKGPGTLLQMVRSGVPAAQAASYRGGWKDFYWQPLKAWFGGR